MNLTRLLQRIDHLLWSEDGPTTVEYAVMLSLIVGICIGSVRALSDSTGASFEASADSLQNAMNP